MQLKTKRCRLRPLAADDRDRLAEIGNDRRIWRNLGDQFPHPYTIESADNWIEVTSQQQPIQHLAIEFEGELVGGIGFELMTGEKQHVAAVGYWLAHTYWNQGIATEALSAVIEYVHEVFPQVHRIQASVFGWNLASGRVLEKCGFRKEATFKDAILKDGELTDEHMYGLILG